MFKLNYRLMEEVAEGGEGGSTEQPRMYTREELDAEIAGLKANNERLLSEKKETARKAKEAEDARTLAEQERAKQSGKLEEFEASLRGEFDKERQGLQGKLDSLTSRVVGESKKATISQFSGDFIDPSSTDLIAQLVSAEFDGENVTTQFKDFQGNVITTDAAEFKKWMQKHPALSHLLKADAATGGGAAGSKFSGGGATKLKDMSLTERAKLANENPKLYAQLSSGS
jgi:hypothetical protein